MDQSQKSNQLEADSVSGDNHDAPAIENIEAEVVEATGDAGMVEQTEEPVEASAAAPATKKKPKWVVPVLVVLVLLLGGVGGFFGYRYYVQNTEATLVFQANQALRDGLFATAESSATTAIETKPDGWRQHTLEAQAIRGMALFKLDRHAEALVDLNTAIAAGGVGEAGPSLPAMQAARAWIYVERGETEKAMPDIDAALDDKADAGLLAARARLYVAKDQVDNALADIDASLAIEAEQDDLLIIKATILLSQGDREGSMAAADAAQAINDEYALPLAYDAEALYLERNFTDAIDMATRSISKPDAPAFVYRIRGGAYLWQYQTAEALADLDMAINRDPKDAEALALRGFYNLEADNYAAFEADTTKAAELDPEGAAGLYAKALLAAYQHRFDDARTAIDQAISLASNRPEFYVLQASLYKVTKDFPLITAFLDKALELAPDFRLALPLQARYEMLLGHFEAGKETGEQLIANYPDWEAGYLLKAEHHFLKFEFNLAEEVLVQSTSKKADSYENAILRGNVFLAQSKTDKARNAFEESIKINANLDEGYIGLAAVECKLGNFEEALANVDKALEIDPTNIDAMLMRYWVYMDDGDSGLARQATTEAKSLDPDSLSLKITLLQDMLDRGDPSSATRSATEMITKYPDRPDLYVWRALSHVSNGRTIDAQTDLDQAFLLLPNNPQAFFVNALLNLANDKLDDAIRSIENALVITPEDGSLFALLGEVNYAQGNYEQTEINMTKALELDPGNKAPTYLRALARLAQKNYTGAAEDLKAYKDSSETAYSSIVSKLDNALSIMPADFELHIFEDRGIILALPKDANLEWHELKDDDDPTVLTITGDLNGTSYQMGINLFPWKATSTAMDFLKDWTKTRYYKYYMRYDPLDDFNTFTEKGARGTFRSRAGVTKGVTYFFQTKGDLTLIEAWGNASGFPALQEMFDAIAKSFMRDH